MCKGFDYNNQRGFTEDIDADSHCLKCIDPVKSVDSTTFGSCSTTSYICNTNQYFELSSPDIKDLGSCKLSTICNTFDYGTGNGFVTLEAAEHKCKTCQDYTSGIVGPTSGPCG